MGEQACAFQQIIGISVLQRLEDGLNGLGACHFLGIKSVDGNGYGDGLGGCHFNGDDFLSFLNSLMTSTGSTPSFEAVFRAATSIKDSF